MWIPKGAMLVRGQCLFEAQRLLEEIWYSEFISISYHGKINSKDRKNTVIPVFQKVTELVARTLVAIRKKEKLVKVKPQH